MQRAVIAIGVKKTGSLPELQAAVASARDFAAWAKEHQRIQHVRLITDERSAVSRDRVFSAVQKVTELGFIEQLIVYFSGHGINVGQGERWLLSKAPADPAAAVNVRGSELNARFCGVGHVVFVSDACRTAADSIQAQNVSGSEIFPNVTPSGPERPVDQFYAALVGHPALEVKSVADAAAAYRAAYSEVLLKALRGEVPELMDTETAGRFVRAWPLKRHLLSAVPQFLRDLGVTSATQQPDARIESEPTAWLSGFPPVSAGATADSTAKRKGVRARTRVPLDDSVLPPTAMELEATEPAGLLDDARDALNLVLRPEARVAGRRPWRHARSPDSLVAVTSGGLLVAQAAERAAAPFGPDHFETACGIKVRGALIRDAVVAHALARVGSRSDVVQVTPNANRPSNVAVQLDDGSMVLVPTFPGYIASLSFDRDVLLEDVAYEPSTNATAWIDYAPTAQEARRLRAVIAGTSALGVFRLDGASDAERLMARLLRSPAPDPALAILAAYALHDRRRREAIRALDTDLTKKLGARVFDVALLTFTLTASRRGIPALPCVPLLSQGWSLLGPLGVQLEANLGRLRDHLRPSLWTHFSSGAADLLIDIVRSGKVG